MTALNLAATKAGLRAGMTVSKAQALVRGLVIKDAEPDADREALERLAIWALRYSPIVTPDPPDGLVIDVTGATHLHGGESALLKSMVEQLRSAGITARAAMADTWGAAHAMARTMARSTAVILPADGEILLSLPISALRLPPATINTLMTLGFETIGDLAEKPRAPLALRFGPELNRRIDQVFGQIAEPITPVLPANLVSVRRVFGEPIGAPETIARYVGKLVAEFSAVLETRGLGAKCSDLLLHRVDSKVEAIRIGTALPTRDVKRLTRLFCDKIETIDPGFGIELMSLTATLAEPFDQKQMISSLAGGVEADVSTLIDILSNRVGEANLYRMVPVASDVPERSFERVPAMAADTGRSWQEGWPRPARLLATPEPVETIALLPDHPPVWFTWRGIRRKVKCADGPERIFGEWWKRDAELSAVRDYFQIEDDSGERYWLFRAGDGEDSETGSQRWFLHGIFA